MKRSRIITLIILAVLLLTATIIVLRADRMAENMAAEYIRQAADEQQIPLSWSDLNIRLLHGSIRIDSLSAQLNIADSTTNDTTYLNVLVPRLDVGRIHWLTLLRHRVVRIDRVRLTNGNIALSKHNDHTELHLDSLCLAAHDLRYNLLDSTFTYNDSVYLIRATNIGYTSDDGLFSAKVGSLATEDAGCIILTDIIGGNTDKREQHAVKMGKQEVTWARFNLSRVRTTPVNIIRMALTQQVMIDTVSIDGPNTEIYYDAQFPPKQPYPMPQQSLAAIEQPLLIKQLSASLGVLHLAVTLDGKHVGLLDLKKTRARVSNISNTPGNTLKAKVTTHIGGSEVNVTTGLTLDKRRSLTYNADIKELKGHDLVGLTKPLLGVELNCNIHSIHTECKGDSISMGGTFCMCYDSLNVHLDENGPMKDLSSLAWLINPLASVVLYNRNPRNDNELPATFEVSADYDPMQPFPAYYIAIISDGIIQSILPFGMGKGMLKKKKK